MKVKMIGTVSSRDHATEAAAPRAQVAGAVTETFDDGMDPASKVAS
jgi:hypothetical protein